MSETETPPDGEEKPTHERLKEMDDDERAEFEAKEAELEAEARDAAGLSADEQEALDALKDPIEEDLASVELRPGVTVEVKTYLSGEMEDNLTHIEQNRRDLKSVRGTLAETMAWLIEDDDYANERVWQVYAEEYGVMSLSELFFAAVEPAIERMENSDAAQKFRAER